MPPPRRLTSLANTLAFILSAFIFAVPTLAQRGETPNVTGEWSLTMEGPQGMVAMEIVFAQDEDLAIVGTLNGPMGETEVTGAIEGDEIMFWIMFETPGGDVGMFFTGKVEENKRIVGEVDIQQGEFLTEFTAERKEG